jgi:hypothetical protein
MTWILLGIWSWPNWESCSTYSNLGSCHVWVLLELREAFNLNFKIWSGFVYLENAWNRFWARPIAIVTIGIKHRSHRHAFSLWHRSRSRLSPLSQNRCHPPPKCTSSPLSPPAREHCQTQVPFHLPASISAPLLALFCSSAGTSSKTVISYNRRRPHSPPSNCQSRANSRLDSPLSTIYHCLLLPLWWPLRRWTIPVIPRPADSSPSMPSMPRAFTTHQLMLSTTSPTPRHHHSSTVKSHHHGGPSMVSLSSPFRLNRVPQPLLQL